MYKKSAYFISLIFVLSFAGHSVFGDMVAYYPLDEGFGTVVRDFSGYRHVGIAQAEPVWVDGLPGFGKALYFDGSEPAPAWVNCSTWNPSEGTGKLTVACWVRWDGSIGEWHGIVAKRDSWDPEPDGQLMWYLEINATNGYLLFGRKGSYIGVMGAMPAGEWKHVAVTFDKITERLYVDGEERTNGSFTLGPKEDATITIGADNLGGGNGFNGAIDEVRLYNKALTQDEIRLAMFDVGVKPELALAPNPSNNEVEVPRDVVLSWKPGIYATGHNVYFGTDFNDVNEATVGNTRNVLVRQNQTDETYDPGILEYGKTYYWRIDEVNELNPNSPWKGNTWNFTVANFITVDDFESYNDYQPDRIFDKWTDGYGTTTNGATVGYPDPDFSKGEHFVETSIIHRGEQSMPYFYDNNMKYSEAFRPLDGLEQNWTRDGVTTLSLWYKGYPAYYGGFVEQPAGIYTMSGSGADIWKTADEFHFAYKEIASGSCSIIAKVESFDAINKDTKAGIMIRDSLEPGSINTTLLLTPDPEKGLRFQYRKTTDADTIRGTEDIDPNAMAPYWLRLERTSGGLIRAYRSPDGNQWEQFNLQTISMQMPIYIGLAVTSHDVTAVCEARFSNVSFPNTNLVSQEWTDVDIGIKSNGTEPMYVVVSSGGKTATVYHDDLNAANSENWTQWSIPLQKFADQGADLTNIKSLGIGLGDINDLQPGGKGIIYIDDIRLYRPEMSDSN
jgi:hypothetical protein